MEGIVKMLKVTIICYVFVLIGFEFCESNCESRNARIIIIGAGPAGIAAASKLFENGFNNVTILEAENRIGGRVHTTKLGNYSVDLGGQWVHGQGENVAYQLAYPYGLLENETETPMFGINQEFFDSLGNTPSENVSKSLSNFFMNYVYDTNFENETEYNSIGQYAEKMFDEQFQDTPQIFNEKNKYLHYLELMRLSGDAADSWHDISALASQEYKTYPGDQLVNWKERGYSTILDILMKRYPDPANELPVLNNTVLETEVTSINYSNEDNNDEGGHSILINTANGQLYKADHVIVTVSLGVLKERHASLFIPPLPDYKITAIKKTGFGSVAKIYLLFDKPFWERKGGRILSFSFIWNEDERKIIEADSEKMWLLGMYSALTVEHKPNLLTVWIVGKYAKAMEAMSEEKVFSHTVENLNRFLGKKYNFSAPVAMLRTRWYSNPHFNGTYSFRSVDTFKEKVTPEMLERPLPAESLRVLFAGEATSTDRFSTVDGAIGSGWKAADRLIDHCKNKGSK